MIKIIQVPVGYPSKMANAIEITILPIPLDATNCSIYFKLLQVIETKDENGEIIINSEVLSEGNSLLTDEQFKEWGQDMAFVGDCVLKNLKLERE